MKTKKDKLLFFYTAIACWVAAAFYYYDASKIIDKNYTFLGWVCCIMFAFTFILAGIFTIKTFRK